MATMNNNSNNGINEINIEALLAKVSKLEEELANEKMKKAVKAKAEDDKKHLQYAGKLVIVDIYNVKFGSQTSKLYIPRNFVKDSYWKAETTDCIKHAIRSRIKGDDSNGFYLSDNSTKYAVNEKLKNAVGDDRYLLSEAGYRSFKTRFKLIGLDKEVTLEERTNSTTGFIRLK